MGESRTLLGWLLPWLLLLHACVAGAQDVVVSKLADLTATPDQIISGSRDDRFETITDGPIIYVDSREPIWFRITATRTYPASDEPQLLLLSPFVTEVEAWVPGVRAATRHSLFGEHADRRYSTRGIVIDLPRGLQAGEAVYLRAQSQAAVPITVAVESRDEVHREDLEFALFRGMVLSALLVTGVLALSFWAGAGERSFLYFAGMVLSQVFYLLTMGGEIRDVPLLGELWGTDPRVTRVMVAIGAILANEFNRSYLDLPRRQPVIDVVLRGCSWSMAAAAVVMAITTASWSVVIGNLILLVSTITVLVAAVRAALRRQRDAYFLLISWLPVLLSTIVRILELLNWIVGPPWLDRLFPASFAIAGLLLTVGLAHHMLQLRRDRDRATQLASQDALTETYSRRGIDDRLRAEVAQAHATGRSLSIAFLDFDRFKQINDTHGHAIGDQCLRVMCQRVMSRTRHRDILGRFGGDELLVLMPDTPLEQAVAIANAVREDVASRPMAVEGLSIPTSLSIGVAELQCGESADAFVERADAALYASKNGGRDRVTAAPATLHGAAYA